LWTSQLSQEPKSFFMEPNYQVAARKAARGQEGRFIRFSAPTAKLLQR
jgi:hypothetical protein